jgi:hypothetical protein
MLQGVCGQAPRAAAFVQVDYIVQQSRIEGLSSS